MIDQLTIDKIRDTAQILDVVSDFVSLRRRGQNYVGLCPFHSDKNPSFYVSPAKNVCKCFSCNEGGDPIGFIMKHEQIGYLEALRWVAKRYGIEIQEKELSDAEKANLASREAMLRLNEFAMATFEEDLYNTPEGRNVGLSYFYERGLQDATIKRFHLGYALESKTNFAERAMKAGHPRNLLLDPTAEVKDGVGLCYGDDPQRTPVCRFAGRVIFPFISLSGKPVAFGGRILQRVDHAFKKYVNSPESTIYHKGNMLYGIYQAKKEITSREKCYIVEGNVDVISMSQAGFENVVASAGTALTTNQIRIIQRFTKNVTLMFDGDEAGIRASLKSIDLLLLEGLKVKLLLFPDGDDPDSFCRKHTTEELQQFFDTHEQDFITYKAQMLLRDTNGDPQKKSWVLQNIVQSIALIDDTILSGVYQREIAQMLNVPEMNILQAIQQQRKSNYANELKKWEIEQRRNEAYANQEAEQGASPSDPLSVPEASAAQPSPTQSQGATQQQAETYRGLPTDRFERNLIRYLVRYGGVYFPFSYIDENNERIEESWRVVDFIGSDLTQEGIEFHHPLYAKMLQLAYEGSEDPEAEFNSIKFFTSHPDPEVSRTALDLAEDRNEALGIAKNVEELKDAVPRALLELKECMLRMEIEELNRQLRMPGCSIEVMQRLTQLTEIKRLFDKQLGERIITG